jgi:hypothetical protein
MGVRSTLGAHMTHGSRWLSIAVTALALASFASIAPSPASAATITYDLVGVTATIALGDEFVIDTLTGNFTFDPTTTTLSAVDIFLAGPVQAIELPDFVTPSTFTSIIPNSIFPFIDGSNQIVATNAKGGELVLAFTDDLGLSADPLSVIIILQQFSFGVTTGAAVPTPLPAALPLFASSLGALGLLGWRRKRRAQVAS